MIQAVRKNGSLFFSSGNNTYHERGIQAMRELDTALTPEQKNMVRQVVASLEIEDMHPSEENIRMLEDLAAGRKSVEQVIEELDRKYKA
ncbi:antitoxin VbhA family protein [bacterium]|nr:antitoxin VbhA family protein [bacterium]